MAVAELDSSREFIRVASTWSEKDLVRQVPGARAIARDESAVLGFQTWRVSLTWGACVALRGIFGPNLDVGPDLQQWAWAYRNAVLDPVTAIRNLTEWPDSIPRREHGAESDDRLYPFQQVGSFFLEVADGALLGDEMGTGKTVQALRALMVLKARARFQPDEAMSPMPACVVCPNSVKRHWKRLIEVWFTDATPYVVTGGAVQRRKVIAAASTDPTAIVIINYEAVRLVSRLASYGSVRLLKCAECDPRYGDQELKTARCEVHHKELNEVPFRTTIYDEGHRLGDPKSKQTRACWYLGQSDGVQYRWLLSGTLFDRPEALWSLLHAVAPAEFPSRTKFIDRYMLQSWNAIGQTVIIGFNPMHREELFSFLDPHFRRMPKALVLTQLPPKVRSVRAAPMTRDQARMYKELSEGLITTTEDGQTWVVPKAGALRTRLLQLAAASVDLEKPDEDDVSTWKVTLREPAPRLDVLEEVVDELGTAQFIVCAPHRQLIELAHERMMKRGVRSAIISGHVSEVDRDQAIMDLADGKIQCICFVMKAGGEGLDMSAAGTVVRIQRSDSIREDKQAEDRAHRIGSEIHDRVHVIDVISEGTIEELQVEMLNTKLGWLEEVNRDKARLLAAGYSEHSPEVLALDQIAMRITAMDVWEEVRKEEFVA